jgi:hypothetical protein
MTSHSAALSTILSMRDNGKLSFGQALLCGERRLRRCGERRLQ